MREFQGQVDQWMLECFGREIANDKIERNHRFLEEALELVQACGCSSADAHMLVEYVFNRPKGAVGQEVGGVAVTLAALCSANAVDLNVEAHREVERICLPENIEKIRAKQAGKPRNSPLPLAQVYERMLDGEDLTPPRAPARMDER